MASPAEQSAQKVLGLAETHISPSDANAIAAYIREGDSDPNTAREMLDEAQFNFKKQAWAEEQVPPEGPGLGGAAIRGAVGMAGFPGDIENMAVSGAQRLYGMDPNAWTQTHYPAPPPEPYDPTLLTSQEMISGTERRTGMYLPPPVTAGERIAEVAGAGFTGGALGLTKGTVKGGLTGFGRKAGANIAGSMLSGAGAEAGRAISGEEGAGPLVGSLVATLSGYGVVGASKWMIRPGESKRAAMAHMVKLFDENLGGNQTLAATSGSGWIGQVEHFMSSVPGAIGVMKRTGLKITQSAQKRLSTMLGPIGTKDKTPYEVAGKALYRAMGKRVEHTVKNGERMFRAARGLIGDTTQRVRYRSTRMALLRLSLPEKSKLAKETRQAARIGAENDPTAYAKNLLAKLNKLGDLPADPMVHPWQQVHPKKPFSMVPYEDLDDIRKTIGSAIRDNVLGDEMQGALKEVYAAMTDDLKLGASLLGGPRAKIAVAQAKKFWKSERLVADGILNKLAKKEAEIETFFDAVINDRLGKTTKMRELFAHMGSSEKKLVAKAWVVKMGKLADDGSLKPNWDMKDFVRNWDNASQRGMKQLMQGNPKLKKELDRLVKSMRGVVDIQSGISNPRATAGTGLTAATIWYTLLGLGAAAGGYASAGKDKQGKDAGTWKDAVTGAAIGLAGGMAGVNVVGRLLTEPVFVRWAANTSAQELAELPKHLARLNSVVRNSDDAQLIDDIDTFATFLITIADGEAATVETSQPD